jgi:hypothetical protein
MTITFHVCLHIRLEFRGEIHNQFDLNVFIQIDQPANGKVFEFERLPDPFQP